MMRIRAFGRARDALDQLRLDHDLIRRLLREFDRLRMAGAGGPEGKINSALAFAGETGLVQVSCRTLDAEMIRLGKAPGYYNGHVPSTAINSMIAALCAFQLKR